MSEENQNNESQEHAKLETSEEETQQQPRKETEINTKQSLRERIWIHMAKEDLTKTFRSLCNRIPYFLGAKEATQHLGELKEFKEAKMLMISPDKPQLLVKELALQNGKEILIPCPRLSTGLFQYIKNAPDLLEKETINTADLSTEKMKKSIGASEEVIKNVVDISKEKVTDLLKEEIEIETNLSKEETKNINVVEEETKNINVVEEETKTINVVEEETKNIVASSEEEIKNVADVSEGVQKNTAELSEEEITNTTSLHKAEMQNVVKVREKQLKHFANLPEKERETVDGLSERKIKNDIQAIQVRKIKNNIKGIETQVGFKTKNLMVDMVVIGSVCVDKMGHRIGDGEGFADLEYAILSKMKAVNENTVVVTTVHDCQIIETLPHTLFEPYDLPVDIIVTPTQTIVVQSRLKKPNEINWSLISKRRVTLIPVLREIKQWEEKQGKIIQLKEDDSDVESRFHEKIRFKDILTTIHPKLKDRKLISDNLLKKIDSQEIRKKSLPRKRRLKSSENSDKDSTDKQMSGSQSSFKFKRSNNHRYYNVDFSVRLANIDSSVRVRDLKKVLTQRGVKPSSITWRGSRGFCLLHFGKLRKSKNIKEQQPVQVDSIVANLQNLKINSKDVKNADLLITVEPVEPVTRIEVVDVTAV